MGVFSNRSTTCEECGHIYDKGFYECPKCHKENPNGNPESRNLPTQFMPNISQLYLFLTGLIGLQVLAVIFSLIASAITGVSEDVPLTTQLLILSASYFACVAIEILIAKNYLSYIVKTFINKDIYIYVAVGVICLYTFDLLYGIISQSLWPDIPENVNQTLAIDMIKSNPYLMFFVICLLGPISEEFAYRVGIFGLIKKYNKVIAYVVSIAIFALIHIDFSSSDLLSEFISLPSYIFAGALFTYIYDKKGFAASFLAHSLGNTISFILILLSV